MLGNFWPTLFPRPASPNKDSSELLLAGWNGAALSPVPVPTPHFLISHFHMNLHFRGLLLGTPSKTESVGDFPCCREDNQNEE